MFNKFFPMNGFEPRPSGIGSNRSTNRATTTASMLILLLLVLFVPRTHPAPQISYLVLQVLTHSGDLVSACSPSTSDDASSNPAEVSSFCVQMLKKAKINGKESMLYFFFYRQVHGCFAQNNNFTKLVLGRCLFYFVLRQPTNV